MGLCALILIAVWAAVLVVIQQTRDDAIEAEVRQNANLTRVLEEQTVRVLATADQATLRLRDTVIAGGTPDLVRLANETGLAPAILVQLSLVGPDGRFTASNIDPDGTKTGRVDLRAREHIRAHLDPGSLPQAERLRDADDLFIGKPVLGKVSGRWTIQASRRIQSPDGQTLGVVVASLDPSYFESVYRRVALGQDGVVALGGSDLVLRARIVNGESNGLGEAYAPSSAFARTVAPGGEGHLLAVSQRDGIERVVAYRRVSGYPLHLLVGTSTDVALSDWRHARNNALALTALLSGVVLAAVAGFVVGLRRLSRTHEALRVSEAQAHSANQAKSEFLAAISHELRTPLTSIRGFSELMERRLEQHSHREQAGLIRKAAEYLNELLTQILDLAKVEAGAMQIESQPVDLKSVLSGAADFFALSAADKGLKLTLEMPDDVPGTLQADPLRLKQVLNNLLSNAIKFTAKGSVGIRVEVVGAQVQVHVTDTGPGIDPTQHELIFERFRQANANVSYQHGGTGLGLALSRALAQLMGGELTVASQLGQGARFTLALPLGRR